MAQFQQPNLRPPTYQGISNLGNSFDQIVEAYQRAKALKEAQNRQGVTDMLQYGAPLQGVTPQNLGLIPELQAFMEQRKRGASAELGTKEQELRIKTAEANRVESPTTNQELPDIVESGGVKFQKVYDPRTGKTEFKQLQTPIEMRPVPGYRYTPDGALVPIPGGPAAQKEESAADKAITATEAVKTHAIDTIDAVDKALKSVGRWTTGYGSLFANLPATDARAFSGYIDTLKAKLSFQQLQEMRSQSKTGGALGNVSDNELRLLSSAVASLDPGQDAKTIKENLTKIKTQYERVLSRLNKGESKGSSIAPPKSDPMGIFK